MQRDSFIDHAKISIKMFKLTGHPVEPAHHGAVVHRFTVRTAQKLVESSADKERLRDTPTPRFRQEPRGSFF
jgi:hypothetical protein